MDCQRVLPFLGALHRCRVHLVGRYPKRWEDRWTLGLGHSFIHRCLGHCTGKGGSRHQYLDKVSRYRHSRKFGHLVRIHAGLWNCCANAAFLDRISWSDSEIVHQSCLLGAGPGPTSIVPDQGLFMEIVSSSISQWVQCLTYNSAKRMYKPQTYHHIQEIQKYNIQDYRPRYVYISLLLYNRVLFY